MSYFYYSYPRRSRSLNDFTDIFSFLAESAWPFAELPPAWKAVDEKISTGENGERTILLSLAGYGKEDVKVTVRPLTEGESRRILDVTLKDDKEPYRSYRLSPKADVDAVTAECKNGLLTIRVPEKTAAALPEVSINVT